MRATTTPAKRRTRGIASAMIMSAVVGFSILGSGTALAGNTSKQVYFGSGPTRLRRLPDGTSFDYPANYSLSFTPVSSGRVTSVYVTIQNKGGGTLNHVVLEGGNQAPRPDGKHRASSRTARNGSPPICTGSRPRPASRACPTGFSYVAAYRPGRPSVHDLHDAAGPRPRPGGASSCDVGQLPNNASVTYRFAIQVPANSPWRIERPTRPGSPRAGTRAPRTRARTRTPSSPLAPSMSTRRPLRRMRTSSLPVPSRASGPPTCDQPATLTGGAFATGAFAKVDVKTDARSACPASNASARASSRTSSSARRLRAA